MMLLVLPVWTVIGFVVYFGYSRRNSQMGKGIVEVVDDVAGEETMIPIRPPKEWRSEYDSWEKGDEKILLFQMLRINRCWNIIGTYNPLTSRSDHVSRAACPVLRMPTACRFDGGCCCCPALAAWAWCTAA